MQSSGNKKKIESITSKFRELYGDDCKPQVYFSPGRIEIGGNHTDHNNGRILAAGITIGTIAAALPGNDNIVRLYSANFKSDWKVNLGDLNKQKTEEGQTSALIRGIAAAFNSKGYKTGGFNCVLQSDLEIGSGLSSSASVEMIIACIFNDLFNKAKITPLELAKSARFAENEFFGKPCGLMDQLVIAEGGIVSIDFFDTSSPKVKKLNFDFNRSGYSIIVVNTGSAHDDLTKQYAAIPHEMKSIAEFFDKETCRSLTRADIINNIIELRSKNGDRAVLRSLHYLAENERVAAMAAALKKSNLKKFFKLVNDSGLSSALWLQNMYVSDNPGEQSLNIALELTKTFLKKKQLKGACRVHGGGFAGTILSFIPKDYEAEYCELMNNIFGNNAAVRIAINAKRAGRLN